MKFINKAPTKTQQSLVDIIEGRIKVKIKRGCPRHLMQKILKQTPDYNEEDFLFHDEVKRRAAKRNEWRDVTG